MKARCFLEQVVNGAAVLLAVIGFLTAFRLGRFRAGVPCLLTIAYFPVVLLAMFPLSRYVVGFLPCLCVAGSLACVLIQSQVQRLLASAEDRPVSADTAAAVAR